VRYLPTAKNSLVEQLLPRMGFIETDEPGSFLLDLSTAIPPECNFLREGSEQMEIQNEGSIQ
jgi:predicted enzyme involved in methoxymalonyl-ACP biosynthesis